MPTGQKALFSVEIAEGTGYLRHYLGTHAQGAFGTQDYFWVSTPIKLYGKGGTQVNLRADRDLATGTAKFRLSLSGHLEW